MSASPLAPPSDPGALTPAEARALLHSGLDVPTAGWSTGFAQANLIALPREAAFDFLLFAQRNPKPCPVLEVLEPGEFHGGILGADSDVRTDAPSYRVWRDGELAEETTDAREHWTEDMVAFLIGCSFTFEHPLLAAGVPVRHIAAGRNVPMYRTSVQCRPAGRFSGRQVVSMRAIPAAQVADAVRISSRYPSVHGAPVHVGDPAALGIADLDNPDFGDPPVVDDGDVPVFWACGVTPQSMVMESSPPLAITHSPGKMIITDAPDTMYQVP
ncbi:putative hydro-lyase [Dietzia sp.]|uniref:putative hydro-lyase n=1 Tax=Dietzia sp. TaxID=1871616 RepID=UPI002FDB1930